MVLAEKVGSDTKGKEVVINDPDEDQVLEENNNSNENRRFCVLIVDDQSLSRLLHKAIVTSLGLEAQFAEDGKKAVDLHRAGASFDLILMDRDMPVMNGTQATRELRAMGVDTMIVGVTGDREGLERQDFEEAGLNDCYTKPISTQDIAALVQKIKENKGKSKAEKSANNNNKKN